MSTPALRPRERDSLIQSLRAGVTPLLGARHIQVAQTRLDLAALASDDVADVSDELTNLML